MRVVTTKKEKKTKKKTMMLTMMMMRRRVERDEDMKKDMTQMRQFKVGGAVDTYLPNLIYIYPSPLISVLSSPLPSRLCAHDAPICYDTPYHGSWRI